MYQSAAATSFAATQPIPPSTQPVYQQYVPTYQGDVNSFSTVPDAQSYQTSVYQPHPPSHPSPASQQQQQQQYSSSSIYYPISSQTARPSSVPVTNGSTTHNYVLPPRATYNSSSLTQANGRPYSPGSIEVENLLRERTLPPIHAQEDIRNRDARVPELAIGQNIPSVSPDAYTSTTTEPLQRFNSTRTNRLRPIVFQPNGSFRALKESGKLTMAAEDDPAIYKGRNKNPLAETAYHLPGYTGYVRGRQHISGRSYGELTRRALSTEYEELACVSPVPSSPQANRKIVHEDLQGTFVANMFGGKNYMVPGYTGFVPGVRSTFAKCYGSATADEMRKNAERWPRGERKGEEKGFATTSFARPYYALDSAPLPGGLKTQQPPEMFIPQHVKYLKFFPM